MPGWKFARLTFVLMGALCAAGCGESHQPSAPGATATQTSTASRTATIAATNTPVPTNTPPPTDTPTIVPTNSPLLTNTPTLVATDTPTPIPTHTPTSTDTPSPLPTASPTQTPTATWTVTVFATPTAVGPVVRYDRTDTRAVAPFPDDFWLTTDASTATGSRVDFVLPTGPHDVQNLYRAGLTETDKLDGFSPIGHVVIDLSDAPDPASLPLTPAASLDPQATVGIFDLTEGSATRGQRVPFALEIHNDPSPTGGTAHALLLFPSIPLTPGGHYGVIVTFGVRTADGAPFGASPFFQHVLDAPTEDEPAAVTAVRPLVADVLDTLVSVVSRDDVALAVRFSVRSVDDIPLDLLSIKEQVLAAPPPTYTITSVVPDPANSKVAAIVTGTWQDPDWRGTVNFVRGADGRPVLQRTRAVPFTLALPKAALQGPVPITMYQHGSPGSAEAEVPSQARLTLAGIGHAVIGFTDNLNREVSAGITDEVAAETAQVATILIDTIANRKVPDYYAETNAEQIAFVRFIQSLGSLDVLPVGAPDGVPDLDVTAPLTYVGISEGANHGPGLLPYAPEIRAAALVAGGSRLAETVIHQGSQEALQQLGPPLFPDVTPIDLWVVLAIFQTIADNQDPHNHARFIYRDPVTVAGTAQKASILLLEGLNDSLVPNNATNSLAWAMGPIPHLKPVQRVVPYLETVDGPVLQNIDANTTAAFFQYVPVGVEGIAPTPGCAALPIAIGGEGHYCAQRAPESLHQREVFFQTAVSNGVPTIINPFAE